jgi:hypothetical protein
VEVEYPDRESAFAAARRWADERGDTAVAWRWPTFWAPPEAEGDGNEREGWRVNPGTVVVADVAEGKAAIPATFVKLAQLLAIATPDELVGLRARLDAESGVERADLLWHCAESCVDLYRYRLDGD